MIPNYQKVIATFKTDPDDDNPHGIWTHSPVIAWDEDGNALVEHNRDGCLKRATSYSDFQYISADDGVGREVEIVAALPGNGWVVRWTDHDTPTPVFAWLVSRGGSIKPVVMSADGYSDEDVRDAANFKELEQVEPNQRGRR